MCKKNLQSGMTDISQTYRDLLAREMRGPADCEGAMHRLQTKFGLDYWAQWSLKYRSPKKIAHDVVVRIQQAHTKMLEQSVRRDLSLLEKEVLKGAADADVARLVTEARGLLDKIEATKAAKEQA
jgi:hypothetical protein